MANRLFRAYATITASAHLTSKPRARFLFSAESPVELRPRSPFEYQINKRVARLCTSRDLVRFFPPSSRHVVAVFVVAVVRFLYGCTEKAMLVRGVSGYGRRFIRYASE